ncbi:MAG: TrbG/VirB9 family P-type conjugative transfer protein [Pseudomonadota bacterium]
MRGALVTRVMLAAVSMLLIAAPGHAKDPRIKSLAYVSDSVVPLTAHLGYQLAIEFQDDESIENVAIGDSASWQVTPNRRGSVLIIKPVNQALPTNMTVLTSQRRYSFALMARNSKGAAPSEMTFVMKFVNAQSVQGGNDPADVAESTQADDVVTARPKNTKYSFTGSAEIIPAEVFDDGGSTYFRWTAATPAPAIFLLGKSGERSLVNHSYVDDYVVVDRVSERFQLQLGQFAAVIYNDAFSIEQLGPQAPVQRPPKPGLLSRMFGGGGR